MKNVLIQNCLLRHLNRASTVTMVHLRWVCRCGIYSSTRQRVKKEWFMFKLAVRSLAYNSLASWTNIIDVLIQPLFWIIDHVVRYTGPAFILLVTLLVSSVVATIYMFVFPYKFEQSVAVTCVHFITGHWLLLNIVFHYVQATFTNPGNPAGEVEEVVSICKVCIAPKAPRTHHCSVCQRCILKMDHHCPWLNNCVGFYNHRYFFLFSIYMCIASFYVSVITYPLFTIVTARKKPTPLARDNPAHTDLEATSSSSMDMPAYYRKQAIVFVFVLSSAVSMALLLLVSWHARLIHRGETSIEVYINSKEVIRLRKNGLVFRNPYNLGAKRNWKMFLGLTHGRTFWRHVLLPSAHKPDGHGQTWDTSLAAAERGLLLL